jgi:carboxypeptidase Taq
MNSDFKEDYTALTERLEDVSRLGGIMGILHWDQEVIMPSGASESRAQQLGTLAGTLHEKSTHPEIGKLLDRLTQTDQNDFTSIE